MRLRNALFGFLTLLLLLVVAACQSTATTQTSQIPGAERKGVVISSTNGSPVTVYLPTADGKDVYALTGDGAHECADCKAAALKYLQGGELETKCPTCGATRTAVTFQSPTIGHN